MPTDGFQVIGRCGVQQQPNSLADRLVAAEFIEKLNDEIGVERRIKLVHHENSPSTRRAPLVRCRGDRLSRPRNSESASGWLVTNLTARARPVKSCRQSESEGDTMETVEVAYRGYLIKQPSGANEGRVCVESENPHLLSRLLGQHSFEDPHGVERAIKKAQRYIDVILG
jgi:hypothetical protein